MGQLITVTTTDGVKKLDVEAADRLKLFVGGVWYDVEPPHIAKLLEAYVDESHQGKMAKIQEDQLRGFVEQGAEARRRMGGAFGQ